jgi:excisionase family DNA binding protein
LRAESHLVIAQLERERAQRLYADSADAKNAREGRLLTPAELAKWLNVDRSYVYEHAAELGAQRLGNGPKARLRFDLEDVKRWISCSAGRTSDEAESGAPKPIRRGRRASSLGTTVDLLPVRGQEAA